MPLEAMALSVRNRTVDELEEMAASAASSGLGLRPVAFSADASRSAWTMPSFYLVPFMCAYIFGFMWIIGACSSLCRMASRG